MLSTIRDPPPSLEKRDGGAVCFQPPPILLPHSKREVEGVVCFQPPPIPSFIFQARRRGFPSFQPRCLSLARNAGGHLLPATPGTLPRFLSETEGIPFLPTIPIPLPRSKRETEGGPFLPATPFLHPHLKHDGGGPSVLHPPPSASTTFRTSKLRPSGHFFDARCVSTTSPPAEH